MRSRHAGSRSGLELRNAVVRIAVDAPCLGVLFDQCAAHPGVGAPVGVAPHQHITIDIVCRQLVGGQIDPAALQILIHVASWLGTSGDTAGAIAMLEQVVDDRLPGPVSRPAGRSHRVAGRSPGLTGLLEGL